MVWTRVIKPHCRFKESANGTSVRTNHRHRVEVNLQDDMRCGQKETKKSVHGVAKVWGKNNSNDDQLLIYYIKRLQAFLLFSTEFWTVKLGWPKWLEMHLIRLIATSISGTKCLLYTHHCWREIRTIKVLTLWLEEIRTVAPNLKKRNQNSDPNVWKGGLPTSRRLWTLSLL